MLEKKKIRNNQEWLELIQECPHKRFPRQGMVPDAFHIHKYIRNDMEYASGAGAAVLGTLSSDWPSSVTLTRGSLMQMPCILSFLITKRSISKGFVFKLCSLS